MENHPIPQDVTGFKFKLIGSITVKQFLYLIVPSIVAYIFYSLPLPLVLKIPFVLFSAGAGLVIAFLPIDGRSMDVIFFRFIQAIPSENQYIYRRKGALLFSSDFLTRRAPQNLKRVQESEKEKLRKELLLARLLNAYPEADQQELTFFTTVRALFEEASEAAELTYQQQAAAKKTTPQTAQKQLDQTQAKTASTPPPQKKDESAQNGKKSTTPHAHPEEPPLHSLSESKVYRIVKEREQKTLLTQDQPKKPGESPTVKKIAPLSSVASGFPTLPDVPNIILGVVKDSRGKLLPNILVEVLDQDNNPVRAFKTNMIGQFASATPLPISKYKIVFTDPKKQHEFDTIEISLTGEIFSPLEVTSTDEREKLRRDLFGS